jgi:hypothetical protein
MNVQPTDRGFVSDDEYARFWNPSTRPVAPPTMAAPQ